MAGIFHRDMTNMVIILLMIALVVGLILMDKACWNDLSRLEQIGLGLFAVVGAGLSIGAYMGKPKYLFEEDEKKAD